MKPPKNTVPSLAKKGGLANRIVIDILLDDK
jgi:hypothetical protein